MTKAEFLAILEKHLNGTASANDRRLLNDFYRHHAAQSQKEWTFTDKERVQLEIFASLNTAIDNDVRQERRARFGRILRVAASVAILLLAGYGFYLSRVSEAEIKYATESTYRGEQKTVTLPDGSVVRLNAESSITFPEQFASSDTRDIQLTGEAFFEVRRDEERPFIIRSANVITTVLGTEFNVRAYPGDKTIAVTVATGKVRIEASDNQQTNTRSEILLPGEQGLYDHLSASLVKSPVNIEKFLAWKDGTILLEGASLEEATEILGRWYDADFVFKNPGLKTCTIDGKFRNDELENILENLRFLLGIEYSVEPDKTIIIDGKSCH